MQELLPHNRSVRGNIFLISKADAKCCAGVNVQQCVSKEIIKKLFVRYICKPPEYTGVLKSNRCAVSSGLLCSSHYPRTGTLPKKADVKMRNESRQPAYSSIQKKK